VRHVLHPLFLVRRVGVVALAVFRCHPASAQISADPAQLGSEAERLAWVKAWTQAKPLYAPPSARRTSPGCAPLGTINNVVIRLGQVVKLARIGRRFHVSRSVADDVRAVECASSHATVRARLPDPLA
jgi:hypothetical protein